MRKWAGYVLGGILLIPLLVGAALLVGTFWLRANQPERSVKIESSELGGPVEVIFDSNAAPHIFAESLGDAYFALGHVHARDRLWQMEVQRRIAQGRMSEILGRLTLELDKTLRTLDLYRAARESFTTLPPEVRGALQAYTAGVNSYLQEREAPLPLEFQLTFHRPELWQPADTLVWFKTMALLLGRDYRSEMLRAQLLAVIEPKKLYQLFMTPRSGDPLTVPQGTWSMPRPASGSGARSKGTLAEAFPAPPNTASVSEGHQSNQSFIGGEVHASNTWVVSGRHTVSGKPILANDPHLALDAPALWYLARIVTPGHEIAGATVPGVPFHLLGQNGRLAWGITASGIDAQDLIIETVKPSSATADAIICSREETVRVRFQDPVAHTVRWSQRGPLLSDVDPIAANLAGPGRVLALMATVFAVDDTTAAALYRLNRASNVDQGFAALKALTGTNLNVVLADSGGAIAYLAAGQLPIRESGDGWLPRSAGEGEADWSGFVPFEHLPQLRDPEIGWIFNANNSIAGDEYPYFLAHEWESPYRALRIAELLESYARDNPDGYSVEDAMAMQGDTRSLAALDLLDILLLVGAGQSDLQEALDMLSNWDGEMLRERPEPLLFWQWVRSLNRLVFADELGPSYEIYAGYRPRVLANALRGEGGWCDSTDTPKRRESCKELIRESLRLALEHGREAYGADIRQWRWGEPHRALLEHRVLSRIPLLSGLVDISIETDGGNYTLNRGASYGGAVDKAGDGNPYAHVHGAGYRAVYDLARPGNSRYVIATGQSGNPLSPHYQDFVERWRDGRYVMLTGKREELRTNALGVLDFSPSD